MYHSIYILRESEDEGINTYDDWHIVPTSRPVINPPAVKTEYLEIPGATGALDYTGVLTGSVPLKDRTGSWEFYVLNGYEAWFQKFSVIMNNIQGRRMRIWLEDDPEHYYTGRLRLNSWKSAKDYSQIQITYQLDPERRTGHNPKVPQA